MLESSILQTVVFEKTLVLFWHSEGLQNSFILQFEWSFRSSILHLTQSLHVEFRVIDKATAATDWLIVEICIAFITLVVNFDELDFSNETKYFDHVSYDLIWWNCLNQLYSVIRLEVSHLVFDFPDNSEICNIEDKLHIDINLVRNFPQCIFN